jgi:riboflavin synthase
VFTGIVRERGRVATFDNGRLVVEAPETSLGVAMGDSISVEGVCLTAVAVSDGRLEFDVIPESRERAKPIRAGDDVNIEPALRAGEPLGGHYVQGHVDAVGRVRRIEPEGDDRRLEIEASGELLRYCVEKGSIAVDGVALTITRLTDGAFEVALVPHTLAVTTLGERKPGDEVNLEVDLIAKYVEKLVRPA